MHGVHCGVVPSPSKQPSFELLSVEWGWTGRPSAKKLLDDGMHVNR